MPDGIDLGTCVRISLSGGRTRAGMTEPGVVIEVVPAGCGVRSARIAVPRSTGSSRSSVARYVVQCWTCRILRRAAEMVVECL